MAYGQGLGIVSINAASRKSGSAWWSSFPLLAEAGRHHMWIASYRVSQKLKDEVRLGLRFRKQTIEVLELYEENEFVAALREARPLMALMGAYACGETASLVANVRQANGSVPLLVVGSPTCCAGTDEEVNVLNAGADDYVRSDCSFAELLVRLEALLRRCYQP